MKQHIIRSAAYFLRLSVLLAALFALMYFTGTGAPGSSPMDVLITPRGWALIAAVIVLAAFYPYFGYVDRRVKCDLVDDFEKISRAFDMGGYGLVPDAGDRVAFRPRSTFRRIVNLGQDAVTVTRDAEGVVISGLRKEVVKAVFRLEAMITEAE